MNTDREKIRSFMTENSEILTSILQNRLLDESSLIRFAKDRGVPVAGVVKGDPGRFLELGWLESDEIIGDGRTLFHPFRIFPIHRILKCCDLNFSPSSLIDRDDFSSFLSFVKDRLLPLSRIAEFAAQANMITDLAIILEPIYWPSITSRVKWNIFVDLEEHKKLVAKYKDKAFSLIQSLNTDEWGENHKKMRIEAAYLDDNTDLYVLLRLSPWTKREKLKDSIGAALWFRHMAELVRLSFEENHGVTWPEEDMAFSHWVTGARKRVYGSERPTENPVQARPNIALDFGLHTGSLVRWYLEGDTEYQAALSALPQAAAGGIELINLKGAVGKERANAALRLEDGLNKDRELGRFSVISFDTDVMPNVKAVAQQVKNGNVVGKINANNPDFEFGNFSLKELVEVAAGLESEDESSSDRIRTGDWSGVTNGSQFEERYLELGKTGRKGLKGDVWGQALAQHAIAHPCIDDGKIRRPFIETLEFVLRSLRMKYSTFFKGYRINPETFVIEKLENE